MHWYPGYKLADLDRLDMQDFLVLLHDVKRLRNERKVDMAIAFRVARYAESGDFTHTIEDWQG